MIVATKKNDSLQCTVNLQKVIGATLRETHHTPCPHDLVVSIPANQKKDCWNNYHRLKLAKSAKNATSFITKWVWYPYWFSYQKECLYEEDGQYHHRPEEYHKMY